MSYKLTSWSLFAALVMGSAARAQSPPNSHYWLDEPAPRVAYVEREARVAYIDDQRENLNLVSANSLADQAFDEPPHADAPPGRTAPPRPAPRR